MNFRKAAGYACPECGEMLEYVFVTDNRGRLKRHEMKLRSKHRMAPDDIEVDKMRKVSAYESRKVGTEWVHTVRYACPRCGGHLSEGQAVKRTFEEWELPRDYYVSDEPVTVDAERMASDLLAMMRGEYRSRSPDFGRQEKLDV